MQWREPAWPREPGALPQPARPPAQARARYPRANYSIAPPEHHHEQTPAQPPAWEPAWNPM